MLRSTTRSMGLRTLLFASVSGLALAAAAPRVRAADVRMPVKAPPAPAGELTIFEEGGGSWWAGDPARSFFPIVGLNGFNTSQGSFAARPRFGWDAAAGFDYRFAASPWHVSGQLRYDAARSSTARFATTFSGLTVIGLGLSPATGSQVSTAIDRETSKLADFAFGRDVSIGPGSLQVKVGGRLAEVSSKLDTETNASAAFTGIAGLTIGGMPVTSANLANSVSNLQNASFRGGGPRVGFEGTVPLGYGWQINYLADGAVLFGTRRIDQPVTTVSTTSFPGFFTATSFSNSGSTGLQHGATVPNVDGQIGLSYQVDPSLKVTASYRVDAYFGVISTFDPQGNVTKVDRIFHGPRLTLTESLWPVAPAGAALPGMVYKAPILKAPPPSPRGNLQVFGWGGAFWTGGDPVYTFLNFPATIPNAFSFTPQVGWDAGGGFDYRFAGTPWHVDGRFDYGAAKKSASAAGSETVSIPGYLTYALADAATSNHREHHWVADFAVGRDFALGRDSVQFKGGVRVAELTARTSSLDNSSLTASGPAIVTTFGVPSVSALTSFANEQKSQFRGVGPTLGVEGSVPLRGGFAFDYSSDIAVLFGRQTFRDVTTTTTSSVPPGILGPSTTVVTVTDVRGNTAVPNADIEAGFSYWVSQSLKVSASYRLDAFFGVLKTLDASGRQFKADRYFHGPRATVTANF